MVVFVLIGVAIGWCLGYVGPAAQRQRKLLKEYQELRESMNLTDEEMADTGRKIPQFLEDVKRQDEMTAVVALVALKLLEQDDIEGAKARLAFHVGSYYRLYHGKGGDPDLLDRIEEAAQQHPIISAELTQQSE